MSELFDLQLEADTVEGGEVLRGRVEVKVDEERLAKAKALEILALARIRGAGTTETVEVPIKRLEGPFTGRVAVEFEQRLPRTPVSWKGLYVLVEWMVRASLEVPWATDPKIEVPFRLVPRKARGDQRQVG